MHKMLDLADHMMDEAKDGKSYAEDAAKLRDTNRYLAECYSKMAEDRLQALRKLKDQATRLYEDKTRDAAEHGKDVTHLVEAHEWCMQKVCHEECELAKMIEAAQSR